MERQSSSHPCHNLSNPSKRLFWCRHCMTKFIDPIQRWRHSKTCKKLVMCNPRLEIAGTDGQRHIVSAGTTEGSIVVSKASVPDSSEGPKVKVRKCNELVCQICKAEFFSLDDMKDHVKQGCTKPTSSEQERSFVKDVAASSVLTGDIEADLRTVEASLTMRTDVADEIVANQIESLLKAAQVLHQQQQAEQHNATLELLNAIPQQEHIIVQSNEDDNQYIITTNVEPYQNAEGFEAVTVESVATLENIVHLPDVAMCPEVTQQQVVVTTEPDDLQLISEVIARDEPALHIGNHEVFVPPNCKTPAKKRTTCLDIQTEYELKSDCIGCKGSIQDTASSYTSQHYLGEDLTGIPFAEDNIENTHVQSDVTQLHKKSDSAVAAVKCSASCNKCQTITCTCVNVMDKPINLLQHHESPHKSARFLCDKSKSGDESCEGMTFTKPGDNSHRKSFTTCNFESNPASTYHDFSDTPFLPVPIETTACEKMLLSDSKSPVATSDTNCTISYPPVNSICDRPFVSTCHSTLNQTFLVSSTNARNKIPVACRTPVFDTSSASFDTEQSTKTSSMVDDRTLNYTSSFSSHIDLEKLGQNILQEHSVSSNETACFKTSVSSHKEHSVSSSENSCFKTSVSLLNEHSMSSNENSCFKTSVSSLNSASANACSNIPLSNEESACNKSNKTPDGKACDRTPTSYGDTPDQVNNECTGNVLMYSSSTTNQSLSLATRSKPCTSLESISSASNVSQICDNSFQTSTESIVNTQDTKGVDEETNSIQYVPADSFNSEQLYQETKRKAFPITKMRTRSVAVSERKVYPIRRKSAVSKLSDTEKRLQKKRNSADKRLKQNKKKRFDNEKLLNMLPSNIFKQEDFLKCEEVKKSEMQESTENQSQDNDHCKLILDTSLTSTHTNQNSENISKIPDLDSHDKKRCDEVDGNPKNITCQSTNLEDKKSAVEKTEKRKRPRIPKCRACDRIFKTIKLLQSHNKFPCKIKHTRNLCQKVLRPKRASVSGDPPHKHNKTMPNKSKPALERPQLLPHRRISDTTLEIPKSKKIAKKTRRKSAPAYIFCPAVKEYRNTHLSIHVNYDTLSLREKYFFDLGMISSVCLMPQCLEDLNEEHHVDVEIKEEVDFFDGIEHTFTIASEVDGRITTPPPVLEKVIFIDIDDELDSTGVNCDELSPPILEVVSSINDSPNLGKPLQTQNLMSDRSEKDCPDSTYQPLKRLEHESLSKNVPCISSVENQENIYQTMQFSTCPEPYNSNCNSQKENSNNFCDKKTFLKQSINEEDNKLLKNDMRVVEQTEVLLSARSNLDKYCGNDGNESISHTETYEHSTPIKQTKQHNNESKNVSPTKSPSSLNRHFMDLLSGVPLTETQSDKETEIKENNKQDNLVNATFCKTEDKDLNQTNTANACKDMDNMPLNTVYATENMRHSLHIVNNDKATRNVSPLKVSPSKESPSKVGNRHFMDIISSIEALDAVDNNAYKKPFLSYLDNQTEKKTVTVGVQTDSIVKRDNQAEKEIPEYCVHELEISKTPDLEIQKGCEHELEIVKTHEQEILKGCEHEIEIQKAHELQIPKGYEHELKIPKGYEYELEIPKDCQHNLEIPKDFLSNLEIPKDCQHVSVFQKTFTEKKNSNCIPNNNANLSSPKSFQKSPSKTACSKQVDRNLFESFLNFSDDSATSCCPAVEKPNVEEVMVYPPPGAKIINTSPESYAPESFSRVASLPATLQEKDLLKTNSDEEKAKADLLALVAKSLDIQNILPSDDPGSSDLPKIVVSPVCVLDTVNTPFVQSTSSSTQPIEDTNIQIIVMNSNSHCTDYTSDISVINLPPKPEVTHVLHSVSNVVVVEPENELKSAHGILSESPEDGDVLDIRNEENIGCNSEIGMEDTIVGVPPTSSSKEEVRVIMCGVEDLSKKDDSFIMFPKSKLSAFEKNSPTLFEKIFKESQFENTCTKETKSEGDSISSTARSCNSFDPEPCYKLKNDCKRNSATERKLNGANIEGKNSSNSFLNDHKFSNSRLLKGPNKIRYREQDTSSLETRVRTVLVNKNHTSSSNHGVVIHLDNIEQDISSNPEVMVHLDKRGQNSSSDPGVLVHLDQSEQDLSSSESDVMVQLVNEVKYEQNISYIMPLFSNNIESAAPSFYPNPESPIEGGNNTNSDNVLTPEQSCQSIVS